MNVTCACCGKEVSCLRDVGWVQPWHYATRHPLVRIAMGELSADYCSISRWQFGPKDYFVRGVLAIPITSADDAIRFGVWVSHSAGNFRRAKAYRGHEKIGPFPGYLCTEIRGIGVSALNIPVLAHYTDGGSRPSIEVKAEEHPIAVAQRFGVALCRADELLTLNLPR